MTKVTNWLGMKFLFSLFTVRPGVVTWFSVNPVPLATPSRWGGADEPVVEINKNLPCRWRELRAALMQLLKRREARERLEG